MESRFLSQAAKFLQEQKKNKRWTVVFVCLAAVVALGTVTALKLYGQAMTHKVKVLNCGYEVHTHDEGCYDEDGNLTCVYADYVVHVHNDDCYDPNSGELVCQIPEREPHEHTEECYEEEEVLICGEEESEGAEEPEAGEAPKEAGETEGGEGHEHTEACYTKEKGDLICEIEGHTHDDSCYSETLVCEEAEHTHDDGCYDKVLDCDDDSEEHEHDDGCYTEEFTCEKDEHTHGEGCYEKSLTCEAAEESHEHTDECYAWNEVLTCTSEEGKSEEKKEEEKPEEKKEEDKGEKGHTHTDECYKTEKVLTCGELELHTHDDSCYEEDCFDEEGNLIEGSVPTCGLLQLEEHVHTGDCFKEIELTADEIAALNAGAVLHIHVDSCYDENGNLICGHDATHIHNTECYDADGNLICGYAGGHTHDESCYDENGKQICGQKETTHIHNKDCYDEEGNLICGDKDKTHEHGMNCYDKDGNLTCGYEVAKDHEHDVECYDADDKLICGFEGMKDHRHNADCYDEEGNLTCERIVRAHEHEDSCYDAEGNLICGYEEEYHIHTADCYDEEGNLICGYINGDAFENTATYEGDGYIVTAMYNNDAELPEGAELIAEQITAESDAERYTQREAEYQEMVEDEKASMRALFKIGFYVEGEEVEPKSPVAVTIQFLDEDGLAEGKPITVVHFAEEGAKKIDGSNAKDGSTSFKTGSFSEFAIGYSQEKKIEVDENGVLHIDGSFKYDADPFHITFHVKGEAQAPEGDSATDEDAEDETGNDPAAAGEGAADESEVDVNNTAASMRAMSAMPEAEPGTEEEPDTEEPAVSEGGNAPTDDTESTEDEVEGNTGDESDASTEMTKDPNDKLEFMVQELESTTIRDAVLGYFGDTEDSATRRVLHTLSYKMTYDGVELDLKDCKVTAVITMGAAPAEDPADAPSEEAGEDPADTPDGEDAEVSEGADTEEGGQEDAEAPQDADTEEDAEAPKSSDMEDGEQTAASIKSVRAASINNVNEDSAEETGDTSEGSTDTEMLSDNASDVEVTVTAFEITADGEPRQLGVFSKDSQNRAITATLESGIMAFSDELTSNPTFTVQYYAYAKIMDDRPGKGDEAVRIVDTVQNGKEGELNGAVLPDNNNMPQTRLMNLKKANVDPYTSNWVVYNPVYKDKNSTESLTKIYTADFYEYREAASGLSHINKFAKEGLHYDLVEVWILKDAGKVDSTDKEGWDVYSGADIEKLVFRNNDETKEGEISVHITENTVIRLVGRSNTEENKSYPARFFDYDFSNGGNNIQLQGINNPLNYKKEGATGKKYGFGNNSSGETGLKGDTWGESSKYNTTINVAKTLKSGEKIKYILEKCFYGLVEPELENGLPKIKADAPDLFNPENQNVVGKEEVTGRSLVFDRDGDTFTLKSVSGSESSASNLDKFQLANEAAYWTLGDDNKGDPIFTNQFWPMDNAPSFGNSTEGHGEHNHDPKFGRVVKEVTNKWGGIDYYSTNDWTVSDDHKDHNSFFGMTFEVEFELTDDYVGPLNYYFFGDDDMWVFLEYPEGKKSPNGRQSELICDIGGVHQAAGEYVDLWNYIQKPEDKVKGDTTGGNDSGNRVVPKYKLKFFYTERGASGSTCWMQFTLPSVNAVPVIDYTGNVKSTLTLGKRVEGEIEVKPVHTHGSNCYNSQGTLTCEKVEEHNPSCYDDQGRLICNKQACRRFDFTIEFSGTASNIATNDYPYKIKNADESEAERGDIRSGGTFKLGHGQTIEVFNLPDDTKYIIKEKNHDGYAPELGNSPEGTVIKNETVEGNIDWDRDDILGYINKEVPYELPETGGSGMELYTIAGALCLVFGAGFMYRKKFRERRA